MSHWARSGVTSSDSSSGTVEGCCWDGDRRALAFALTRLLSSCSCGGSAGDPAIALGTALLVFWLRWSPVFIAARRAIEGDSSYWGGAAMRRLMLSRLGECWPDNSFSLLWCVAGFALSGA